MDRCFIFVVRTLDFGLVDVEFWLCGREILVGWMLDFGFMHVGFDWVDVRFWLYGHWFLFVCTMDFECLDVEILLLGRCI